MLPDIKVSPEQARILVIEDEVLVRTLIAEELRDSGFHVVEAANADEALVFINSGSRVDLVFSDISMPGPVNGLDLARQLRDRYPSLPIILTSGNAGPRRIADICMFIAKPYQMETAVTLVREALGLNR